jgi:hypothetical protein
MEIVFQSYPHRGIRLFAVTPHDVKAAGGNCHQRDEGEKYEEQINNKQNIMKSRRRRCIFKALPCNQPKKHE